MFENGLFIFRRDLRIVDNNGLHLIHNQCKNVYTVFIFTPEQVGKSNKYKSNNAVQFMIESLNTLSDAIHNKGGNLYCFYGENVSVISSLIDSLSINLVVFNQDYTPYALERDASIMQLCEKKGIEMETCSDYYLFEPGTITSGQDTPYKKFTPYYEKCLDRSVQKPEKINSFKLRKTTKNLTHHISLEKAITQFTTINENIAVHGGREEALQLLKEALKSQKKYGRTHNELAASTSQLSASIKFGCVSIREVYYAFKPNREFIRQLIWREFYMNVLFSFPEALYGPEKPNYKKIHWHSNQNYLEHWKKGTTGFPVVDAGMRQLLETGYMHNRARLIVASFLVKTLLINWQEGEEFFAKRLTDYDPASNNGNWQWISGSGADSQPYFRIFNPWEQSKKLDPDCIYIKKWIPELNDVPNRDIHNWNTSYQQYKQIKYNAPIVDYSKQKVIALKMYAAAFH